MAETDPHERKVSSIRIAADCGYIALGFEDGVVKVIET